MTLRPSWNEIGQSEEPAVHLLKKLGYAYVGPETLNPERESRKQVILAGRLATALRRLNPWLSDENVHRSVRALTEIPATSLLEANEKAHTILVYGISLEQDRGDGKKSHPVRFIDFDDTNNNDLVVTTQFKVKGPKQHVIPDVVLFVNGIPLVAIECKSPTLGDVWLHEAVDQLDRYQELSERYKNLGAPHFFHTVQVLVATCGQASVLGTVGAPQRAFGEWKIPYPRTIADLAQALGREPSPQDVLFYGALSPSNLLDIARNFVAFERDENTVRTVRKVCRYQQYQAVNRAALRARTARKPEERGGVVWHTQGSGKSLSLLWLALKLKRDPKHENPTLVVVSDRTDLDEQITKLFRACGFPNPERAGSVRKLREFVRAGAGRTVMTTVQKFQDLAKDDDRGGHPVLNTNENLFVLVDEAHRTQYGGLAANMRHALPSAAFFAFTGTPIDKKDRSTLQTFGAYIDTYTIEQAVKDGATVPIFYESRLPELRLIGNTLDQVFDRVFVDRTVEERQAIKKRFATEEAIAGAPKRIESIALDLIDHFTKFIQPNGFKAMVVASTRDAAVTFKETLDRLNAPQSAIAISGTNDDDERMVRHHTSVDERKDLIRRFLNKDDPLSILTVCDMLLTGFDAPNLQVMYLDSPLREHTLLQAIARVNRTADRKTYGLIVDYWGVSEALQDALRIFAPGDVKGAMTPKVDELPRLQARHAAAVKFFAKIKDRDELEACVKILEPEDVRAEFDLAFRRFADSLDMVLPDPRGLPYREDLGRLGKIRLAARVRYRDASLDVSDCGAKVRKLIDEAVVAEGIQVLVKEVSIFSTEFDEKIDALKDPEAKASEMEHAIRAEIHVRLEEDPAFYHSLRERLEQLISEHKAKRIDAARQFEALKQLVGELRGHGEAAEELGLSETAFAIHGVLAPRPTYSRAKSNPPDVDRDDAKIELAKLIEETVDDQVEIIDWTGKDDVQREIRRRIKRHLTAARIPADRRDELAAQIVDILKVRKGK